MGTQKKTVKKIIDKEADYVLPLKGNQTTLHEDIQLFFAQTPEEDLFKPRFGCFKTFLKDHGRIEKREYRVTDDIDWLSMKSVWKDLQTVCNT